MFRSWPYYWLTLCSAQFPRYNKFITIMNKLPDPPSLTRFDLAELETFLWVVRESSFSIAARKLHLSQPAVTNRIKRLEDKLRVKLLVRTTRRVEPTEDGIFLRDAAEQAVSGLRDALSRFQAVSETKRNRVIVSVTPMLSAAVMPQLIHAYSQRYPDIQIVLRDLPYEQVLRSVAEGQADIGVTALEDTPRGLRFQSLAEEKMLLVVPDRHPLADAGPVTVDMIIAYPVMLLDRYVTLRKLLAEEYHQRDADFNPATASTLPTLLGMIDAGNYITFLPRSMTQNNAKRTRTTVMVQGLDTSRRYGSVVSIKAELSSATRSFQSFLRQNFKLQLEKLA